tara:strand:- start:3514 stop:4017 length:504 start_codon:yes stop_codon:yes gene_type:complete
MKNYKKYITEYDDFPIEGVKYLDLNPLYLDSDTRKELVYDCMVRIKTLGIEFDHIGAVESRGYMIGSILAHELNKGLLLLRSKPNRLPGETSLVRHTLEYGDAQMEVQNGTGKVLIIDDVIATGGTIGGAINVLDVGGYEPISALFLVELTKFNPNINIPFESIIKY